MKPFAILLCACLLIPGDAVFSQIAATNKVAQVEAIKIASQLTPGMREETATKFLQRNGLTNSVGVGGMTGWARFYTLEDGSSLGLDYTAGDIATSGRWGGNGLLRSAFIQSNGVNTISIAFTNRPQSLVRPKN